MKRLITVLRRLSVVRILFSSVIASMVIAITVVGVMSLVIHGTLRGDFLITGAVAALLTSLVVVSIILRLLELLKDAERRAGSASRAKSDFLSTTSHELRTAMNVILGMGQLMEQADLDEEHRHYLNASNRAGRHLLSLINDILDFSKIEAGQFTLDILPMDLRHSVQEVTEIMSPMAEAKGLALVVRLDDALPQRIAGDAARLHQVLLNLLFNAVKFTNTGRITFSVKRVGSETILFSVSDTGIGIPKVHQSRIFQPFEQGEVSSTQRTGGTGLGLAICQRLVTMMGGAGIEVVSSEGVGSRFSFALPMTEVTSLEGEGERSGICEVSGAPIIDQALTLLVVDDAEDNRLLIKAFLKKDPVRIIEACDGFEAVERCREERFDIILMDLQMPRMDGYEATFEIRRLERELGRSECHIVALTAHAMREVAENCFSAGCDGHLTKPIRRQDLLTLLSRVPNKGVR
ncbi:MAG: response regulator [Magnetococcales bacterium]|nr:response regulator [Magnetococcales bacterium]